MGGFQDIVVSRKDLAVLEEAEGLFLVETEEERERGGVGRFEIVFGMLSLLREVEVAVFDAVIPLDLIDAVDFLDEHGEPLEAVGDLDRNRLTIEPAALLEVGELGDLHPFGPDFPPRPPGAEGGGFPVILDKADVMFSRFNADGAERIEIAVLDIQRRRFHDDLILEVVEETVRVLAVAAVGRPPDRVDISDIARLRAHGAEESGGGHCRRPFFDVVRLADNAALVSPVTVQSGNDFLEIKRFHSALIIATNRGAIKNMKAGGASWPGYFRGDGSPGRDCSKLGWRTMKYRSALAPDGNAPVWGLPALLGLHLDPVNKRSVRSPG